MQSAPFPSTAFADLAEREAQHWWFRARNRLLLWALAKAKPFNSFLEVGCGTGFVLEAVRNAYPGAKLHGAEYFEEGLAVARKRIPTAHFRRLDATVMDESAAYDVIGAFDVLEHIELDEKVLSNLGRALKPGGTLMLTVPQHQWLWSQADDYACHVRRYSRQELVDKVAAAGLRVGHVTSFVSLLVPLMWLSRRAKSKQYDPLAEFQIPRWLNAVLEGVMGVELLLIKAGVRLPFGGSLLLVATRT